MNYLKKANGFSLMELIAVMAIMAILAGSLAPSVFNQIKRAKADAEEQNLKAIMQSLKTYIVDEKIIPTTTTSSWTQAVATASNFSLQDIEFNDYNFRRRLIIDPQFLTNSDSNFTGVVQNQGLANEPVSPRMMLISNLNANAASIANTSTDFNNVWNQNASAILKESSDLKIVRLNLSNLFHRVILNNANSGVAYYQLETGSLISVPAESGGTDGQLTRWVIDQTKISLYSSVGASGLQLTNILDNDWLSRYQTDGTNWYWDAP